MLPKEKLLQPNQTLGIALELAWRMIVVGMPCVLISKLLPHVIGSEPLLKLLSPLVGLVVNLTAYWLAIHWLFRNGRFGRNKMIVMDQDDYQELCDQLATSPSPNQAE